MLSDLFSLWFVIDMMIRREPRGVVRWILAKWHVAVAPAYTQFAAF
ncbi:hypothetical protein [Neorhodopirellula lusitana]|nr:hypothetical protein [Neorhodopirellula lusitana]